MVMSKDTQYGNYSVTGSFSSVSPGAPQTAIKPYDYGPYGGGGNSNNYSSTNTAIEIFIFLESATQPSTPLGGSFNFANGAFVAPAPWLTSPPQSPASIVWVSNAIYTPSSPYINWSVPGQLGGSGSGSGSVTNVSLGSPMSSAFSVDNPSSTPQLNFINVGSAATQFLRGDGTWAVPAGSAISIGYIAFTSAATPSAGQRFTNPLLVGYNNDPTAAIITINGVVSTPITNYTLSGTTLTILDYLPAASLVHVEPAAASSGGGGGSGTLNSVSVVSLNGFAGTSAVTGSNAAITLSTTVTGLLKGDGTAISAATANGDYQAPIRLTTTGTSGAATFSNNVLNIPQYVSGGGGGGTVTSIGLTVPTGFSVTPATAITTSGTFALSYSGQIPVTSLGTGSATSNTFLNGLGQWVPAPAGTGTVTSIGMTVPSGLSVTPSTITTSGIFALTWGSTQVPLANIGSGAPSAGKYVDGGTGAWTTLPTGSGTVTNVTVSSTATPLSIAVGTPSTTPAISLSWGSGQLPAANLGGGTAGASTTYYLQVQSSAGSVYGTPNWVTTSSLPQGTVTQVTGTSSAAALSLSVTNQTTTPAISLSWTGGQVPAANLGSLTPAASTSYFLQVATNASGTLGTPFWQNTSTIPPGTVTSIGLTMPSDFVTTAAITTSGNITVTRVNQQGNLFLASPSTGIGIPSYRNIASADISNLAYSITPIAIGTGTPGVLNTYARGDHVHPFTLTTTGSGAATYSNGVLNVPAVAAGSGNVIYGFIAATATTNVVINSGLPLVDSYQTQQSDSVLLTNQTTTSQNGVYMVISTGNWNKITTGQYWIFSANNGTLNANVPFIRTNSSGNEIWVIQAQSNATNWTAPANIPVGGLVWAASPADCIPGQIASFNGAGGYGGQIWTLRDNVINGSNWSVAFGNNRFVAITSIGTPTFNTIVSTDGVLWTAGGSFTVTGSTGVSMAFGNGLFVVPVGGTATAATSTNGVSWSSATLPSSSPWNNIIYANNQFLAICANDVATAISSNGTTWTAGSLPITISSPLMAYGNSTYVVMGQFSNANYLTSANGTSWTSRTNPVTLQNYVNQVAFGNGFFVLADSANRFLRSTDGISWSVSATISNFNTDKLFFADGIFLALYSNSGGACYTSTDGVTWIYHRLNALPNSFFSANGSPVGFGNGAFVILYANYTVAGILRSPSQNYLYVYPALPTSAPLIAPTGTYRLLGASEQTFDNDALWQRVT